MATAGPHEYSESLVGLDCDGVMATPLRESLESIKPNRTWLINEEDEEENTANETESLLASSRFKEHPTYKDFNSKTRMCSNPISAPVIFCFMTVFFLNLTVLLIYPFDDNLVFGGGSIQQWTVIMDTAMFVLFLLWLLAKTINLLAKLLVTFFFHPYIEFFVIHWRMYEITILGLSWGLLCGLLWKSAQTNISKEIPERMTEIMHDLIVAVILMYALIGLKVFIISTYESRLYKTFTGVIALSIREERDLCRLEKRLFADPKERLITRKFQQINIDSYMSGSPFSIHAQETHRIAEKPDHVSVHVAAATFSQTLIEKCGSNDFGYLTKADFMRLGKGTSLKFLNDIFHYLDTDGDGKIFAADVNIALRKMFKIRKELRIVMRSRRVLLETTNTILNTLLGMAAILIFIMYVLEIELSEFAIPLATLILAFSFAYQQLLEDIVNNLYTLFCVRPYNIGDLIYVDGKGYYVEEVGLLCSACTSEDGYIAYISNAIMRQQPLLNMKRGRWVRLKLTCYILPSTTMKQIDEFRQELTFFCVQSKCFSSKIRCYADDTMNPGPVLVTRIKLKGYANWQDKKNWQAAQTKVMLAISNIASELGILDKRNKLHVERDIGF